VLKYQHAMTISTNALLAFTVALSHPLTASAQDAQIAKLQHDLPALMAQSHVTGLQIAVLRHGKTAWLGHYGFADKEAKTPVDDQTIFNIASLSKTVFAYTALRLVDAGKLDLDEPITHYLKPEHRPGNDPRVDLITARFVLSHRTGFANWPPDGEKPKVFFTPGTRFSYSGEGMVVLATAIEDKLGEPLNQIVSEETFVPLGMTESSYIAAPQLKQHFSRGYTYWGSAVPLFQGTTANAAASLSTTAHDYALFLEAILNGRGLTPATLRMMEIPEVAVDPSCTNCLDHDPVRPSTDLFWGLGWGIEKSATGTYLWHWGDNGVYKAYVVVDINRRSAVAMFANDMGGLSIAKAVVTDALGGDHPSFAWLHYDTYDSPSMRFTHAIYTQGAGPALRDFSTALTDGAITENTLNDIGYQFLHEKKYPDAITIFRRNVDLHPSSANTYDSLGEAYMDAGDHDLAVTNYKKSLALNPANDNAKTMLTKLASPPTRAPAGP
jgi:CubicO group peptidase (beta-lactamase class C family)